MDFFEEITRHHMLGGVFPNELLYSAPVGRACRGIYRMAGSQRTRAVETTTNKTHYPQGTRTRLIRFDACRDFHSHAFHILEESIWLGEMSHHVQPRLRIISYCINNATTGIAVSS